MEGVVGLNYLSQLSQIIPIIKFKWYSRKGPYIILGKFGIRYLVMPNSSLDFHLVKNGILNDWVATQLNKLIPRDGIIFDISSNVGLLTLPFAKNYVPKGRVYSYDPDFQNVCQLKINTEINQLNNVVVLPIALQDDPNIDHVVLHIRRSIDGDGLINRGLSTFQQMSIHNINEEIVLTSHLITK